MTQDNNLTFIISKEDDEYDTEESKYKSEKIGIGFGETGIAKGEKYNIDKE